MAGDRSRRGLHIERLDSTPLATPHGSVRIKTVGLRLSSPLASFVWRRPEAAELTRPDGSRSAVAVRDGTTQALLPLLVAAGAAAVVLILVGRLAGGR